MPEIHLNFDGNPKAFEALQQLLRLAATQHGTESSELTAVTNELLGNVERGDPEQLAWFVWLAGYVTAVAGNLYVVTGLFGEITAEDALREIEKVLEKALRGEHHQ